MLLQTLLILIWLPNGNSRLPFETHWVSTSLTCGPCNDCFLSTRFSPVELPTSTWDRFAVCASRQAKPPDELRQQRLEPMLYWRGLICR